MPLVCWVLFVACCKLYFNYAKILRKSLPTLLYYKGENIQQRTTDNRQLTVFKFNYFVDIEYLAQFV